MARGRTGCPTPLGACLRCICAGIACVGTPFRCRHAGCCGTPSSPSTRGTRADALLGARDLGRATDYPVCMTAPADTVSPTLEVTRATVQDAEGIAQLINF